MPFSCAFDVSALSPQTSLDFSTGHNRFVLVTGPVAPPVRHATISLHVIRCSCHHSDLGLFLNGWYGSRVSPSEAQLLLLGHRTTARGWACCLHEKARENCGDLKCKHDVLQCYFTPYIRISSYALHSWLVQFHIFVVQRELIRAN